MSAATTILPPRAIYTSEPIYRWSVQQYHKLIQDGTLTADDPVELLEGALVYKMSKNPPHSIATGGIGDIFSPLVADGWHVRMQEPVTLDDGEPEPDGVIARGLRRDYAAGHPSPLDIALIIEVADATLSRDRGIKLRSYARAGIVCYWIVNLIDRQIEVYTQPAQTAEPPVYRSSEVFKPGAAVPFSIEGRAIAIIPVADLLPPL